MCNPGMYLAGPSPDGYSLDTGFPLTDYLQAAYWLDRFNHPSAVIWWNRGTDIQIYYAQTWWFPAGAVGTVFLAVVSCAGWWYQRGLRIKFAHMVEKLPHVDGESIRTFQRLAKAHLGKRGSSSPSPP